MTFAKLQRRSGTERPTAGLLALVRALLLLILLLLSEAPAEQEHE